MTSLNHFLIRVCSNIEKDLKTCSLKSLWNSTSNCCLYKNSDFKISIAHAHTFIVNVQNRLTKGTLITGKTVWQVKRTASVLCNHSILYIIMSCFRVAFIESMTTVVPRQGIANDLVMKCDWYTYCNTWLLAILPENPRSSDQTAFFHANKELWHLNNPRQAQASKHKRVWQQKFYLLQH